MPGPRYAIGYTPPPESPLARFGASVLGYDCYHRVDVPRLAIEAIDPAVMALMTVEPRRYGFHATIVAQFRLGDRGDADLVAALDRFVRHHRPLFLGPLGIAELERFIVLRPREQPAHLEELAAACLKTFDAFRAPPSEGDRPSGTGPAEPQAGPFECWGSPLLLDQFGFAFALAGPIPDSEIDRFTRSFTTAFSRMANDQHEIDAISLLRQDDSVARFHVVERRRLAGR